MRAPCHVSSSVFLRRGCQWEKQRFPCAVCAAQPWALDHRLQGNTKLNLYWTRGFFPHHYSLNHSRAAAGTHARASGAGSTRRTCGGSVHVWPDLTVHCLGRRVCSDALGEGQWQGGTICPHSVALCMLENCSNRRCIQKTALSGTALRSERAGGGADCGFEGSRLAHPCHSARGLCCVFTDSPSGIGHRVF